MRGSGFALPIRPLPPCRSEPQCAGSGEQRAGKQKPPGGAQPGGSRFSSALEEGLLAAVHAETGGLRGAGLTDAEKVRGRARLRARVRVRVRL